MSALKTSIKAIIVFTLLTGVIYPLLITAIGQLFFNQKANGSFIIVGGKVVGSELVGQSFTGEKYFWPRPSAINYNPLPSSGSNLGPTSQSLKQDIVDRKAALIAAHGSVSDIPMDLLQASGSGLDPHISPEAAKYQVPRIVQNRGLDREFENKLLVLIERMTEGPSLGIFGEPRVNVLKLNLTLDSALQSH